MTFFLCPVYTEMSPESLNLLMILCSVDDGMFKVMILKFLHDY